MFSELELEKLLKNRAELRLSWGLFGIFCLRYCLVTILDFLSSRNTGLCLKLEFDQKMLKKLGRVSSVLGTFLSFLVNKLLASHNTSFGRNTGVFCLNLNSIKNVQKEKSGSGFLCLGDFFWAFLMNKLLPGRNTRFLNLNSVKNAKNRAEVSLSWGLFWTFLMNTSYFSSQNCSLGKWFLAWEFC